MKLTQLSLFDMNLKTTDKTGIESFKDETGKRLEKLQWVSEYRQDFMYNENDMRKLTQVKLYLKGIRRLNKKGKFNFFLERKWYHRDLNDVIADEIPCGKISDLEACFNDEKFLFEWHKDLPKDVLFDGRRYCWKFKQNPDGSIEFLEKWIGD